MFTLINAEEPDEPEITDPEEIAELFAVVTAVAIEALGIEQARLMFEAFVEQEGREPS